MNLNLSQPGRGGIYKYIVVVMLYEIVLRHIRESVVIYSNRDYIHFHHIFPMVFSYGCEFFHFFNLKNMIFNTWKELCENSAPNLADL
jgi:hypothetical protein